MYGLLAWDLVKARRAEIERAAERARLERPAPRETARKGPEGEVSAMTTKRQAQALWRGVRTSASLLASVAATPRGRRPGGYLSAPDERR